MGKSNQTKSHLLEPQRLENARWADTLKALDSTEAGRVVPSEVVDAWLATWGLLEESLPPIR